MTTASSLQSELENLADRIDKQTPEVRELFHYALAMLLVANQKAVLTRTEKLGERNYLTFRTTGGEQFVIPKPVASEQLLETLTSLARDILEEEKEASAS